MVYDSRRAAKTNNEEGPPFLETFSSYPNHLTLTSTGSVPSFTTASCDESAEFEFTDGSSHTCFIHVTDLFIWVKYWSRLQIVAEHKVGASGHGWHFVCRQETKDVNRHLMTYKRKNCGMIIRSQNSDIFADFEEPQNIDKRLNWNIFDQNLLWIKQDPRDLRRKQPTNLRWSFCIFSTL